MSDDFDLGTDFIVAVSLCMRVGERPPAFDYTDAMYGADCLEDIVELTEHALTDWPAHQRPSVAFNIVKRAFQAEFPAVPFPPLGARFADIFRDGDLNAPRQHANGQDGGGQDESGNVRRLGRKKAGAFLSYGCAVLAGFEHLPILL